MKLTRRLLCLVSFLCAAATLGAQGQPGRVTGRVSDADANAPLPRASVVVTGTRLGTQTRPDGSFTIFGVAPGTYRVRVTLIGYSPAEQTVTIAPGGSAVANFAVHRVAATLSQVVVIGYGTQRRSDLTGSVSSVAPNVEQTAITSVEQTLQGTAPGVQVTQASSAPGGALSIRIRGSSSVSGNNEPLYVIDGFPVESDPSATGDPTNGGRTNTAPANPLAALNPNDIASIEILKDASATAIYGARGANGVVIITTKSGQPGRPRVTLDAYTGTQSVAKRYELLNATQFAQFANEYAASQGLAAPYANPASFGTGTDWQSLIFRQAPINNLQLGVSGGTAGDNATRYALSGGTFQQQGVVRGSDFRRISLRGNLDQQAGKRLRVTSNVLLSRVNSSQVPTDGTFNAGAGAVGAAIQYIPILPVRQPDGRYSLLQADLPAELRAINASPGNVPNPVSMANDVIDRLADTRTLANLAGEYTLLPGLRLRSTLGADLSNRTRDTYYPRTTLMGQTYNGRAIRGGINSTNLLNENTLTFSRVFGSQDVTALVGYTRQLQNVVRQNASSSNFVSDITGFEDIGAGSPTGGPGVGSGRTRYTLASYLARLNYSLLNRYLITLTGREDGSSRFGAGRRWGFFPAAAAAWKISEEPFMRRITALDELKLRASWGVTGNPSIQPYQSLTRLSAEQYSFGGGIAPGYVVSVLGNPQLGWESTRQTDLGLDVGIWRERLVMSADVYNKRTNDLLLGIDLPSESGFRSALVNAGSIQNRGFELSLSMQLVDGRTRPGALSWRTTFNYAQNRNRVLSLGGVDRIFASQSIAPDLGTAGTIVQVGQPLGAFYGYRTNGIFRDSAEVAAYLQTTKLSSGTITPGQIRIVDVNGDGVINANDRTIIGNPTPRWTGGWQNSLSWRGFELSSLFDAVVGNDVLNLNLYRLYGGSPSTNISLDRWLNRWTPTNTNGKYPRVNSTPVAIGADFTNAVLEKGSFVRFRTMTVSRAIPARLLRMTNGGQARVYVTGQNLYTWTKYSGFNPDVSSLGVANVNRGIDIGAYPLARSFIFGLNLNY